MFFVSFFCGSSSSFLLYSCINVTFGILIMCDSGTVDEKLLFFSRHGNLEEVTKLIDENPEININFKGQSKSTKCWSALHLSSYFGHKEVVELLLNKGADSDILNDTGDTPLHKAAHTNREDVVQCLLQYGASAGLVNEDNKKPHQMTLNAGIKNILEAAEHVQNLKRNDLFFRSVKEGRVEIVEELISSNIHTIDINAADERGNTALHHAAMRDLRQMTLLLVQNGADPSRKNNQGESTLDVSRSLQIKKLLELKPRQHRFKTAQRFEGPLMKRKRILSPRWHWVVLEKGVISYFARRADAAIGSKRRQFKYLTEAKVSMQDNGWGFRIDYFDGSHHTLTVHQRNQPVVNRKKWVEALQEHIDYSNHFVVADKREQSDSDEEVPLMDIKNTLQNAQVRHQVLNKHVEELTVLVQKFAENLKGSQTPEAQRHTSQVLGKCHEILSTSTDMSNYFNQCLALLQKRDEASKIQLRDERERSRVLQQALQSLATTHHNLELAISTHEGSTSPGKSMPHSPAEDDEKSIDSTDRPSSISKSSEGMMSEEDDFYDAVSGDSDSESFDVSAVSTTSIEAAYQAVYQEEITETTASVSSSVSWTCRTTINNHNHSNIKQDESDISVLSSSGEKLEIEPNGREFQYRETLPFPMFSRDDFSIWHILRQCIGKELSKITMPVIFNEPLSFIQRLCEYMEYSRLLERASSASTSLERMEYVAAFAVSALASQLNRLGKPFNPLLGETFEYQRPDLGFSWVSEQVSHHPPISAFHATGTTPSHPFRFHGCIHPKLKFWGKTVEIEPKGTLTLTFPQYDETYTWTNPKASVHNIVVGKLWIEQHGVMEIVNHKTKERCVVTFKPYSWFRNDLNKVEGHLFSSDNRKVRILEGDWTKHIFSMSPDMHDRFLALSGTGANHSSHKSKSRSHSVSSDDASSTLSTLSDDGDCKCLWQVQDRPPSSEEMYNMTKFAMSLNQNEVKGYELPPTDSRLRPDIRQLENGDIDGASEHKHRLEEKQRAVRKLRHKKKGEWTPRWFAKGENPATKGSDWLFSGDYLKRDWSKCPDIF